MVKLESTFNKSIKIMYGLPWATHRYFIEPLTNRPHLRRILVKRYLAFINKIENSSKKALKALLEISKRDQRTTTGRNLRKIMFMAGKGTIMDLKVGDAESIQYFKVPDCEAWRINLVKELVDIKHEEIEVPGMMKAELDQILNNICTT
jgi:hypothetical protein